MPKLPTFTESLALMRDIKFQRLETSYQVKKEEYIKLLQTERNILNPQQQEYPTNTKEKYFTKLCQEIDQKLEYCKEQNTKHLPQAQDITTVGESSNAYSDQDSH